MSLAEATVRLGKSERSICRMVERGELEGKLLLEHGRYRWAITVPERETRPALAEHPDALAVLRRIEAKLDQFLALQSAPAGTLPIAPEPMPEKAEQPAPRRHWWRRLGDLFAVYAGP